MTTARIIHVDDEPDIREIVGLSLALDSELTVRSCASGAEVLAMTKHWLPDLILLDVMMPEMDGPTTLANLHVDDSTASIPVVFMTARVQSREIHRFKSLGAAGVLAKPFDPNTLAKSLRMFLAPKSLDLQALQEDFLKRASGYANELRGGTAGAEGADLADRLLHLKQIAHRLAGSAGVFGYNLISAGATALTDLLMSDAAEGDIQRAIDALVAQISEHHDRQAPIAASPLIAAQSAIVPAKSVEPA